MSSHHIVRDTQEPALIIANGEACSTDLLNQLLEWNPIVMVLDGALHRVLELGIKIDMVLGDFDREHHPETLLKDQFPVEIIHTPDQEKTDLEKGIEYLFSKGHLAINIVWATGRRADHAFTNMANLIRYSGKGTLVMYDDYSKIFLLPKSFVKWYPKGAVVSLVPVGKVEGVTTSGLLYNLNHETLELGLRNGNSNEALQDGEVTITYTEGYLLLMECHD